MSVFSNTPYNFQSLERFISALGQLFTGITLVKRDNNGSKISTVQIPISYAPKSKWLAMITERPDLEGPQVKITLPRAAFEITDIKYAADRKIGMQGAYTVGDINGKRGKIFPPAPYDVTFNLYVATKDENNASFNVLEQIVPYFQPYMTMKYEILPLYKINKEVNITLLDYQNEDTYDGSPENQRTITQIFTFVANVDFFGPMITNTAVIKEVLVKTSFDSTMKATHLYDLKVNPFSANATDNYAVLESIKQIA
jgi:hypothetical protein